MSIDRSLKTAGRLVQHRNVLSRAERIDRLMQRGNFDPGENDPLGLPKVGNRKLKPAAKAKKKPEATAEGEAPAVGDADATAPSES